MFALFRSLQLKSFRLPEKPWAIFAWLLAMYVFHVVAMMTLEDMTFRDADWLSWTTVFTVGYGDLSAQTTAGRWATKIFMYVGGVFVLASAANVFIARKAETTALKLAGKWRWNLNDHVLIVSPLGNETESYYLRLVREIRTEEGWEDTCVQVLSPCFESLPDTLKREGVVHYHGTGTQDDLDACNVDQARAVVVLGYTRAPESDALVFDIVSRINNGPFVVAECVDDRSRNRFREVGADVVVRPLRGYPEMVARGLTAPGSEKIIEEMFSGEGKVVRKIDLGGVMQVNMTATVNALFIKGLGTIVAAQHIHTTVAPLQRKVVADALFVLTDSSVSTGDIRKYIYAGGDIGDEEVIADKT